MSDTLRAFAQGIGNVVQAEIEDHEERCHMPRQSTDPITAVPFPRVTMTDVEVSRAIELIEGEKMDEANVADTLGVPLSVLLRHLGDYEPRYRRWVQRRRLAV